MSRRGFGRASEGSSLVEFALIVPVLLLILFGILDGARAVNAYVTISAAAREGAHYAALHPTAAPAAITTAVRARVEPLDPASVTVTASYHDGSTFQPWPASGIPASGAPAYVPARVEVSYPWQAVSAVIASYFAPTTMTASSVMDAMR